jgi:hypothetical protein
MTDVRKVVIQVRPPKGHFPGEIVEGHYCVVEGSVVVTDADGKPLGPKREVAGGDAHLIACRMIRQQRDGARPRGFSRALVYPKLKY